jgi:hypothetical protein
VCYRAEEIGYIQMDRVDGGVLYRAEFEADYTKARRKPTTSVVG